MSPTGFENKVAFVWKVADKLRGTFKQHEYGSVILPLLVLRRMDAVLAPTREAVRVKAAAFGQIGEGADALLKRAAGQSFYNTSAFTFSTMLSDDKNVAANLRDVITKLSPSAYRIIEAYEFDARLERMDRAGILYAVLADFADLDLNPSVVSNEAMGYIFEELLRKFSEMSNETAGEHYTPREVIQLIVDLLVSGRAAITLTENPAPVRTVYDPAAGTGGMLMTAMARIKELNDHAIVNVFGQELNDETWAVAQSDLMMQGIDPARMRNGNTLTQDAFSGDKFDFILANPPYGVDWKAYAAPIRDENAGQGHAGRFGAGLPRISDGSFLFLQHMLSHMKTGGSRVGIVLSGSPLFSGQAGSGESEIRRWILENDWLEGIVALPDQMFYNTGISTYVWILTNDKATEDYGLIRLVDARTMGTKMRKSLGDKRKELTGAAIDEIVRLYLGAKSEFADDARVKVLTREAFGFQRITVERPLRRRWEVTSEAVATEPYSAYAGLVGRRFKSEKALFVEVGDLKPAQRRAFAKACAVADPDATIITGRGGKAEPDPDLRDTENVPLPAGWFDLDDDAREQALTDAAETHLKTEIHPYVPDAWVDHDKNKVGVEIPFTRQFYVYEPPRPIGEIAAEIRDLETQIKDWMRGLEL
ncbi:restriction endonuclease subunit M [Rhodococcus sp. 14-2483-1-1]|uniref:type I restriction-modification system subunit M n=1 Tax=Rhodococcus sp. 14-2483-1-1 TaxID=2023148 RepID=UPI000B9AB2F0|nr:class I SAM-dependent DNA methyltransferase [Rhodococcus sp. 14-2483-1-1]OZF33039.1 restriction endonuclease subunit M [Rhodococcus sp. 14-2483-1-1]